MTDPYRIIIGMEKSPGEDDLRLKSCLSLSLASDSIMGPAV